MELASTSTILALVVILFGLGTLGFIVRVARSFASFALLAAVVLLVVANL